MRFDRRRWWIELALVLAAGAVVSQTVSLADINQATRIDASQHISDRRCHTIDPDSCPGQLRCYERFDPDRAGAAIEGPRCVTPQYIDRYCGLLQRRRSPASSIPTAGECVSLSLRHLIEDPGTVLEMIEKLEPVRDGETVLARHGFDSVAADPGSATDPIQLPLSCGSFADLAIYDVAYSPTEQRVTATIENTGIRRLNVTVSLRRGGARVQHITVDRVPRGDGRMIQFDRIDTAPDTITVQAITCSNTTATASIPAQ